MTGKTILAIAVASSIPCLVPGWTHLRAEEGDSVKRKRCESEIRGISAALEMYHDMWALYPPDSGDNAGSTSSILIYLDGNVANGGPRRKYFEFDPKRVAGVSYLDPWGNPYEYDELKSESLPAPRDPSARPPAKVNFNSYDLWSTGGNPDDLTAWITNYGPIEPRKDDGPFAGIVYDLGGIDDGSFNEAAHRGLERAKRELGVESVEFEPAKGAERPVHLSSCAEKCAIVIGVGFMFTDDILDVAGRYPGAQFVSIEMSTSDAENEIPRNLLGIQFREEEGSFLVGAIAGLVTRTKKVGFVGGMHIPLIQKFEAGFAAGVKHVAPDVEIFVDYAGEDPTAFLDPERGNTLALAQYAKGADIIYHASGKTGLGVFAAARETGNFAIGVDSDQRHEAPGHVLTSMVKRFDVAVFESIRAAKEGRFEGGRTLALGVAEQGVDFVYDEHNRELVGEEVYKRVQSIREDIATGRIVVPASR